MKYKNILTTKYGQFLKRFMTGTALFIIPVIGPFIYPMTAHAGLFSFISSLIESQEVSAKVQSMPIGPNSQTIALLQVAAVNHDQVSEKSSDYFPIDDN
ncbi:MAG: hypothetical protein WCG07_03480, partial [Candidatus Taylorbacteria bacterium]